MVKSEQASEFSDIIAIHCYEVQEEATAIGNAWDVCKLTFADESTDKLKGVRGVKIDNDHISRMVSDDDVLYVRFLKPTTVMLFGGTK